MNLHEQMDAAWESYIEERGCYAESDDGAALAFGFRAALALIANPSDDMVERCARALDHPSVFMGGASEQSKRKARAVLKVAGGDV